jgi:flagellar basal-body rod protein FlgB
VNDAFHVAAVGLQAQERALRVISNNIANVNTPAFKRSDVRFSSIIATRSDPDVMPATLTQEFAPAGVMASASAAMDQAGDLQATGRSMDVAVQGRGFIELMGPGGQTLLWRGGALKIVEGEGFGFVAGLDQALDLQPLLFGRQDLLVHAQRRPPWAMRSKSAAVRRRLATIAGRAGWCVPTRPASRCACHCAAASTPRRWTLVVDHRSSRGGGWSKDFGMSRVPSC